MHKIIFGNRHTAVADRLFHLGQGNLIDRPSFGKRRNELRALGQNSVRRVLSLYTPEFLTQSTNMFLTLTIVFYALWSVDVQTELRYAQGRAVWSLPLVILILLFYHYDIDTRPDGDPVEIILHDWRLVVLACVYVAMMLLLM
mgnify:CR=1 FL=1